MINISSHYFVTNLQKIVNGFISKQEFVIYLNGTNADILKSVVAKNKTLLLQIVVPDGDPG